MHNTDPFYIRSHLFVIDGCSALKDLLLASVLMKRIYKMGRCLSLSTAYLNSFFLQGCYDLPVALGDVRDGESLDTVSTVGNSRICGYTADFITTQISADDFINRCRSNNGDAIFNHSLPYDMVFATNRPVSPVRLACLVGGRALLVCRVWAHGDNRERIGS